MRVGPLFVPVLELAACELDSLPDLTGALRRAVAQTALELVTLLLVPVIYATFVLDLKLVRWDAHVNIFFVSVPVVAFALVRASSSSRLSSSRSRSTSS